VTDEVHWSDNLWRMFGLEPGQGKLDLETFRKAIHPGDRFRVMRAIESVLGAGQGCCVEFRVVCPDGTLRWALAHGKAELDAQGRPRRIFGVNMDISSLKEANEALDQSVCNCRLCSLARSRSERKNARPSQPISMINWVQH
jgi:PAS domain S-box-containing protein